MMTRYSVNDTWGDTKFAIEDFLLPQLRGNGIAPQALRGEGETPEDIYNAFVGIDMEPPCTAEEWERYFEEENL